MSVTAQLSTSELSQAAIYFPDGLVGCPDWQRFVQVVDTDEDLPVSVLESLDDPSVQLLVTDPSLIDPAYSAPLTAADLAFLECTEDDQPVTLCTLSVAPDGSISANLVGPLVVNPGTRRGRQIVLADGRYSTQQPVATLGESVA
jgi:flagellar assembly factor FliW